MLRGLFACASVCAFAAGANLITGPSALAQPSSPQAESKPVGLEQVVVTARRIQENLQKVPVAVTAYSGQRLEQLVVNNVQDLNKLSPSLQSSSCSGTRNCFNPTIRGQGTAAMTGQPSVAVYFADVPSFNAAYFDLQDLQILKGPQGTLFGETATGGALLFTPKKPGATLDGYAKVQLGNFAYKSAEGAFGGPIIGDKLMFRVAGLFRWRDGYTKDYPSYAGPRGLASSPNLDNINSSEWRVSLVWKPFDKLENYTVYVGNSFQVNGTGQGVYYANSTFVNPAIRNTIPSSNPATVAAFIAETGQPPAAGLTWGQLIDNALTRQVAVGPRAVYSDYSRNNTTEFTGIINQTRWDVTDWLTIKNIYGLNWTRQKGAMIDTDGTDLPIIDTTALKTPQGDSAWTGGWPARNYSDELQATGKLFGNRLQFQTGLFYKNVASRRFLGQGVIVVLATPQTLVASPATCASFGVTTQPCVTMARNTATSTGAYIQGTFEVLPSLHLTAGYRRSREYRKTDNTVGPAVFSTVNGFQIPLAIDVDPIPGALITSSVVPWKSYNNYTLSADWQVNSDNLLYVAHRFGYKGGGINNNAPIDSPLRFFGPETLTDVEVGWKSDWDVSGIRGRTNIAVYEDWYKNIQRTSLIPGVALTLTSNLANAIIKGVEFETTVFPTDWFDVNGYFAYTDPKYLNWVENSTCGSNSFRPQCSGLVSSTPVTIDHSNGVLTIGGSVNPSVTPFQPDVFRETSKYRWGIQPKFHLKPWLGEDITLGANIYYRSSGQWGTADANTSITAGNKQPRMTVFGLVTDPLLNPGYMLVDLRADWRHIRGSNVSLGASVTNLTDKTVIVGGSGGLTIAGITPEIASEPRMWFVEVSYEFQ